MNLQRGLFAQSKTLMKVVICFLCLLIRTSLSQDKSFELPSCWSFVGIQRITEWNAATQPHIFDSELCKELCLNTEGCSGVAWNERSTCSFFMPNSTELARDSTGLMIFTLKNCTEGDNAPYAWEDVRNNTGVDKGVGQKGIFTENYCRLRCVRNRTCNGVIWNHEGDIVVGIKFFCFLLFGNHTVRNHTSARYWVLNRNSNDTELDTPDFSPIEDQLLLLYVVIGSLAAFSLLCLSLFVGTLIHARRKEKKKTKLDVYANARAKFALVDELKRKTESKQNSNSTKIEESEQDPTVKKPVKPSPVKPTVKATVKKASVKASAKKSAVKTTVKKPSVKVSAKKSSEKKSLCADDKPKKESLLRAKGGKRTEPNLYEDSPEVPRVAECEDEEPTGDEYYTGLDIEMRESVDVEEDEMYTAIENVEAVDEPIMDDEEIYQNHYQGNSHRS